MQANPDGRQLDASELRDLLTREPFELVQNDDRAILGIEPVERRVDDRRRLPTFELFARSRAIRRNLTRIVRRQTMQPPAQPLLLKLPPHESIGDSIQPSRHFRVSAEI